MLRILLVDDDPLILSTLREVLQHLPMALSVQTASSGDEALGLLGDGGAYDVVISDERMPGIRGVELLEHLGRVNPATLRVLMTAYREPGIRAEAEQGALVDLFLYKPFRLQEVQRLLSTAIHDRSAERAARGGGRPA